MKTEDTPIFFADVVNGADVGMIEGRGGTRFALEPLAQLLVASKLFR